MLNWISLLLSEAPGEPSVRRVLVFLVTVFAITLCFFGLWRPVPREIEVITISLIGAAYGALAAGRFAEAMDRAKRDEK